MRITGLNISDTSAELVTLASGWMQKPKLATTKRVELTDGLVDNGIIRDVEQLTKVLQPQIDSGDVAISIPESQVYSRWLRFPADSKPATIRQTITEHCSEYIPYESHEIAFDCLINTQTSGDVFLAAVPLTVMHSYQELAHKLGCTLVRLELESLSSARAALAALPTADATILLDIGARTTIASWFTHSGLRFTFNIPVAGRRFTEHVQRSLKLSALEAERTKQRYGLSGKTETAMAKALEPIVKVLSEGIAYVQQEWQFDTKKVVCIGGSAQLPQLCPWLQQQIQVDCALPTALPWQKSYGTLSTEMLNAVGLALGGLKAYHHWPTINFLNTK